MKTKIQIPYNQISTIIIKPDVTIIYQINGQYWLVEPWSVQTDYIDPKCNQIAVTATLSKLNLKYLDPKSPENINITPPIIDETPLFFCNHGGDDATN